ncbi:MAG: hypothetical protein ABSC23_09705 [Bryobacteraceae bacterium]
MGLRYMGFQQEQNRRVYKFDYPSGARTYIRLVVSVDMALFLKHHVGIQEGPALCAHKLTADLEAHHEGGHELTNDDLLAYAADRAAAAARKAETRRPGPSRRKPEPGQPVSPWWR